MFREKKNCRESQNTELIFNKFLLGERREVYETIWNNTKCVVPFTLQQNLPGHTKV